MAFAPVSLEDAIRHAIETRARQIGEEEICKANEAIARRMREEMAKIILSVHSMYEVQFDRNRIVISVKIGDS